MMATEHPCQKRWSMPPMPVSTAMYMLSPSRVDGFWDLPTSITEKSLLLCCGAVLLPCPRSRTATAQELFLPATIGLWYVNGIVNREKRVSTPASPYDRMLQHNLMRTFPTPSIKNSSTNGRRILYAHCLVLRTRSLATARRRLESLDVSYRAGVLVRRFF
jgi:hypothetical protein